ncbi:MAG: hypothetical protein D6798_06300 [Deltaproteobacteria bacterium]|nr:MAG: hypothetical protein D6798_06300 [Deltaproteobacteria bacterium]
MFSIYTIGAAFSTYFCMYAFRKPFAVGTYQGSVHLPLVGDIDQKILFIISQVLGYCLSKFLGIKVVSEMKGDKRAVALVGVIGFAWLTLLFFAILPGPLKAIALFFNGLPLGMVWGLTFGFLEGRRLTEVLGAGLSASYIVASGAVKTVGKWLIDAGLSEYWMPFAVGAIFFIPLCVVVYLLSRLPPPSKEDEALRTRREPMDAAARRRFTLTFFPGLAFLTVLYVLLTAYRDFRDNFAREIWDALGYAGSPEIMTTSEIPIAMGVLLVLALLMVIKNNRTALLVVHAIMLGGTVLIGASTWAWQAGLIPPAAWMIAVGLGLYVGYVPYGCVLFDRLIAAVGVSGTAGFMIYVTDAFGYLGSVALLLYKNFGQSNLSWLDFFIGFSWVTFAVCTVCFVGSMLYFAWKTR